MLSDYASGVDFGLDMGTELQLDVFGILDKSNVDGFMRQFVEPNLRHSADCACGLDQVDRQVDRACAVTPYSIA